MTVRLIYHNPDSPPGTVSPFDCAILSIAPGEHLCLACPYINLGYLHRIIRPSTSWQLLTDVDEWLPSQDRAAGRNFRVSEGSPLPHSTLP